MKDGEKGSGSLWALPISSAVCKTGRYKPPVYSMCMQTRNVMERDIALQRIQPYGNSKQQCQTSVCHASHCVVRG